MASLVSTFTDIGLLNTTTNAGTITLPLTSQIPYRQITFKDAYGNLSNKSFTLSTQSGETFEDGSTRRVFRDSYGFQTVYGYNGKWYFLDGTAQTQMTISSLFVSTLNSTVPIGLPNLVSTTLGLQTSGFLSTSALQSTTFGLLTSGFLSSPNLLSTVGGLGSIGYISTASLTSSLISTTFGLQTSGFLSTPTLTSTTAGLGTAGYVSTLSLASSMISTTNFVGLSFSSFSTSYGTVGAGNVTSQNLLSTVGGLGSIGYVSSLSLVSTTQGLQTFISSFIDPTELASSLLTFISSIYFTSQLTSTTAGLGTAGYVSTLSLASSIVSTTNFVSQSFSSFSTSYGSIIGGSITGQNLFSTVGGLGSIGYISTLSLASSIVSTTNFVSQSFSSFSTSYGSIIGGSITGQNLLSTVGGLGTAGYVSSFSLNSTLTGLGTLGYVSTAMFNSTINNLGTIGYVSSASLTSTVRGLGSAGYVSSSTASAFFSSLSTAYSISFNTVTSYISGLTVSSLTFGTGDGFLAMPDIRPTALSTLVVQTSSLQAFNLLIGATSTVTAIQYFGLQGNFNNTVLAERSTGQGTQEFLIFKGSSTSDQVRVQTTGNFLIETGVSARLWSTVTQNAVPAFLINTSSNVGIQTATPATTLDVAGTGRFQVLSTLQLNVSSFTGLTVLTGPNLLSTVAGLGTAGYASTLSVTSSIAASLSSFSTAFGPGGISITNITSTVTGLGSSGYISSVSLTSTVAGLGTTGYVSSLSNVLFISVQQILASSIFATLAGPTTVVLYEV